MTTPEQASERAYQVARCIYCFQESLPASRPPPVAFSPPKAPPISAPFVGIFTFTIPQSLPVGLQCNVSHINKLTDSNCTLNGQKPAMDRLPKIVLVLPKFLIFTCAQHPKERVEE